jgi:hypothetical protein
MKTVLARPLFWLLASVAFAASAQSSGTVQAGAEQRANRELRGVIAAQVSARREEVRREEAMAGRRLTAEERAELRAQLRRQWSSQGETAQTAQSQAAERSVTGSAMPRVRRN